MAADSQVSAVDPSKQAQLQGSALGRRIALGTLLGALVLAGIALYGDIGSVGQHLSTFAWPAFGFALLLSSSNYLLRFLRWQAYLRTVGVREVPALESFLVFLSAFVMSVTPGKLGEVYKSYLLWERRGIPLEQTAPIVVAERLTDLLGLVMLSALGSLVLDAGPWIAIVGAVLVALAIAVISIEGLGELALVIAGRLPGAGKLVPRLREAYRSLRLLCGPRPLVIATVLATGSWGLECLALYIVVRGFVGASVPIAGAALAYSTSTLGGALAMLPGGLGVTEAGMATLLVQLGQNIDVSVATGATLLVRLATLWWAVLVGLASVVALRRIKVR
jgi:glycosyltransferase 2 family protein